MRYQNHFDGIRAVCIVFTICNHIHGAPSFILGHIGVDVFFVLSGWLITNILLSESAKVDSGTLLKAFYTRRIFRIVPLYFVAIAVYGLSAWGLSQSTHDSDKLVRFENAFPYLITFMGEFAPEAGVFGHSWTLGIEEKFYLLWPLLFLILFGKSRWPLMLLGFFTLVFLCASTEDMRIARGYIGLGIGCLGALLSANNPDLARRTLERRGIWFALLMGVVYLLGVVTSSPWVNLGMAAASVLLIASLHFDDRQRISRVLSLAPIAYVGKLTYCIYLIHVLVANGAHILLSRLGATQWWLEFALTYGFSIAIAIVLKKSIEDPMIAVGRRLAARARVPVHKSVRA